MQPNDSDGPEPSWQYNQDDSTSTNGDFFEAQKVPYGNPKQTTDKDAVVSWSASEYIAHEKNSTWYMGLTTAVVLLTGLIYIITRSWFSAIMVLLLGVAVWIYAARQPHVLEYSVGRSGVDVGHKHYPYESFRSFAIVQEVGLVSIALMPLQRFMPILTIYFPPDDGPRIAEVLGDYLPQEERDPDLIDRLARRFRF